MLNFVKKRLTSRQGFDLELLPIDRASAALGIAQAKRRDEAKY